MKKALVKIRELDGVYFNKIKEDYKLAKKRFNDIQSEGESNKAKKELDLVIGKLEIINQEIENSNNTYSSLSNGLLAAFVGCILVFSCLFATGNWIYGNYSLALILSAISLLNVFILIKLWSRIKVSFL